MTVQQQAYGLIDRLSEDSVQVVIQLMERMLPYESKNSVVKETRDISYTPKMRAYLRMQELRKISSGYDLSEDQRAAALDAKYGSIG